MSYWTGVYSRNKLECEQRLSELSGKTGLEASFPRMPMIFGPGFYHEPSMMLLMRLINRSLPVPVVASPDAPWASVSSADTKITSRSKIQQRLWDLFGLDVMESLLTIH